MASGNIEAIAFYLPQFHPIPENDAIYGKGFTEWDNVQNASPLFEGHAQPNRPHPVFGYYDLTDEKFLRLQHEMAYENMVKNFCYYYYNFSGKRLLEKPLDLINNNRSIKNRFCLCWAHGSWYNNRTNIRDIFIQQQYTPDNARNLFHDLLQYFENERYITIDGKPLFCVFAPENNPLMSTYTEIWREEAHKHGFSGIWIAGVLAFVDIHPATLGLDSMIEFAPHWHNEALIAHNPNGPRIYDYNQTLRIMLGTNIPNYLMNRGVFPGWDNTPRRGKNGIVFINNNVDVYATYLEGMIEYTREYLPGNMQYIFINAWNEWGETCYLEPDMRNGFSYLQVTKNVFAKYN